MITLAFSYLALLQRPQRRQQPPTPAPVTAPMAAGSELPMPTDADQWHRTHNSIVIDGQKVSYTATCGFLPVYDETGAIKAKMFFVAYTRDGENAATRPVTFAFNGGPGSASLWLHMGTLGPYRVAMNPDGSMPKPPFKVVPNNQSWVPFTDVVVLDAIGSGYSRVTTPGDQQFYGVDGDLRGFTSAIHSYLTEEKRWASPVFVAGESYGGTRVAGLADTLLEDGIAVNGIISMSGVSSFITLDGGKDNDLPYMAYLPSESAVAWYHKRLPKYDKGTVQDLMKKVEFFTQHEYAHALIMGNDLPAREKDAVAQTMSDYLGLSKEYILRSDLRVSSTAFRAELLRDKGESVGRYDARLIGKLRSGNDTYPEYDASDAAITPPFTSAFHQYMEEDLHFTFPDPYRTYATDMRGWAYPEGRYSDTSDDVRRALAQNPYMHVLCCCGYFDLACPFFGMRLTMDHLEEAPDLEKNIQFAYFPAGHMMYIEEQSRKMLQARVEKFITDSLAK